MEHWQGSPYGELLRFCDHTTFQQVVKVSKPYTIKESEGKVYKGQQEKLKASWEKAVSLHRKMTNQRITLAGIRSASPCLMLSVEDVPGMLSEFWMTGVAIQDKALLANAKLLNSIFGAASRNLVVDQRTNPLLGFHLATGYAPLKDNTSLKPVKSKSSFTKANANAALEEFRAWGECF